MSPVKRLAKVAMNGGCGCLCMAAEGCSKKASRKTLWMQWPSAILIKYMAFIVTHTQALQAPRISSIVLSVVQCCA